MPFVPQGSRIMEDDESLLSPPQPSFVPTGAKIADSEPWTPYLVNEAKKGLASYPAMVGLASDLARPLLDQAMRNVGMEPAEHGFFDRTRQFQRMGEDFLGVEQDMQAPSSDAKLVGNIVNFGVGALGVGGMVVKAAKHKIPAITAEATSTVGAAVGENEYGFGGAIIGGLGGGVVGPTLYKGVAKVLPTGKRTYEGLKNTAARDSANAGRDITNAMSENPRSQLNLQTAAQTSKEVGALGGLAFNPTLGQRTGSAGVIALEKGLASSSSANLTRHEIATRAATQAVDAAETAAFGAARGIASAPARSRTTRMESALNARLEVLNDAETRLGGRFPEVGQQQVGEALNAARHDAMKIATNLKNAKYSELYEAADKAGISVDMSDVAALVKQIEGKNVFQDYPAVFGAIQGRYTAKAAKPKIDAGRKIQPKVFNDASTPVKPATFEEVHSLVRRTNADLAAAAQSGNRDGVYYLTRTKELLQGKLAKYDGPEFGDFSKQYSETTSFFRDKFARVFREGAGGRLGAVNRFGDAIDDEKVLDQFFTPSGMDDFNEIFAGVDAAQEVLRSGVMEKFATNVLRDGAVNAKLAGAWMHRHREVLNRMPHIRKELELAVADQQGIINARQLVKVRQKNIDNTYIGKLSRTDNPEKMILDALRDPQKIRSLAALARDPKSQAVMARSVMRELPKAAGKQEPLDFLIANAEALRPLMLRLGPQHEKNLRTIASARGILARSETPSTVTGGKLESAFKEATGTGPTQLLNDWRNIYRGHQSIFAAAGSFAGRYLNKAAYERQSALTIEALYNPEVAEDLMKAITSEKLTPAHTNKISNHLLSLGYKATAHEPEEHD